ncbi:MAG: thiamine pyrophosphate-binding protein [Clostridiaceae bacterium]
MKVSDYIVSVLKKQGVTHVFGFQGGNITHMIDSIGRDPDISLVVNHHEQASAFAANAYALINNTIGVAVSTSGPGAINLVSGIANAYYDSIPSLFITGTVNTTTMLKDPRVRQNAFQETDIVSIVKPITKYAVKIMAAEDVVYHVNRAIEIALENRQGPVLLDIPHDIQRADIDVDAYEYHRKDVFRFGSPAYVERFRELLCQSKRPVILVGGGAGSSKSKELLKLFLEKAKLPVVASLRGLDVLTHDHGCYCGFVGSYGNRYANLAVKYSDLLIVLGARMDVRQVPPSSNEYMRNKKIIHVDADNIELCRVVDEELSINTTCEEFLGALEEEFMEVLNYQHWIDTIHRWKLRFPSWKEKNLKELNENDFIHAITSSLKKDAIICVDVGLNQMCAAQAADLSGNRRFLTSSGHGSMGFGMPAAIGASLAVGNRDNVLCIVGDGGIQMNIQELQTIIREDIPAHIVIMNNGALGMVREFQSKILDGRYHGTVIGFDSPDFGAVAKAYGFDYLKVEGVEKYGGAIDMIREKRRSIIEVVLPQEMTSNPEVGDGIFLQYPYLSREEIKMIEEEVELE